MIPMISGVERQTSPGPEQSLEFAWTHKLNVDAPMFKLGQMQYEGQTVMLKLGRTMLLVDKYAVRVVSIAAAAGLCLLTAAAYVAAAYKREAVEATLGTSISNFLYGVCDPAYEAFVDRRGTPIDNTAKVSNRFKVYLPALAITEDEEAEVIEFIERAFGWSIPFDVTFSVHFRGDGSATFQPYQRNMDQIEINECGYLIGDDYATRQRHAERLRNNQRTY